jgi:arsenate reductase
MRSLMKVYYYPKCSTCKKAITFLSEHGVAFEGIDISVSPPSTVEIRAMIERKGAIRPLFNTSGIKYREGNFADKLPSMSIDDAVAVLSQEGMLVKRPFVLTDTCALLGFKPEEWSVVVAHSKKQSS